MEWQLIGPVSSVTSTKDGSDIPVELYYCPHCDELVLATSPESVDKVRVSILNYTYCPHCGELNV